MRVERRSAPVSFRLSPAEHAALVALAEASGRSPGEWVRAALRPVLAGEVAAVVVPVASSVSPPGVAAEEGEGLGRVVTARLSAGQWQALEAAAERCGLTVSRYVRTVLAGVVPPARRPLARSAIAALNRVGNNLNQLVHLAHEGRVHSAELIVVVGEVHAAVRALRRELEEGEP